MEVIIKKDYDLVCEEAVKIIGDAWKKNTRLVLGLATGNTPLGVYSRLVRLNAENKIDFSQVTAFTLDEYLGLDPAHPRSFAHYMEKNLYSRINIRKDKIFFLSGLPEDVEQHCLEYENKIRSQGGIDLQILGIGKNGHIGFNEPSSSLSSRTRIKTLTRETLNANRAQFENPDEMPRYCLTMGIGTIMETGTIILLASGANKREAIKKTVEGPVTASVPASVLQLHPRVKIIIDEDAASGLENREYYRWVYDHKNGVDDFLKERGGSE